MRVLTPGSRFSGVRAPVLAFALLLGAAGGVPARAQDARQGGNWPQPPTALPPIERNNPNDNLDTLFAALKVAPDDVTAKAIEDRIWALWVVSDSDTCNLLMTRVKAATDAKDFDLALKLLDAIIAIKPGYVEAWNRRATIYYLRNDFGHAIADLGEVLAREPRHFGALSGLGMMLQEIGDDKDALKAYRDALKIDPHLEHVPDVVKELSDKVEGRKI
jgi:tetratricopeptide (TPR) repeat protein